MALLEAYGLNEDDRRREFTLPRFFFHVRDGTEYLDAEGSELKDLRTAQLQSLQVVSQLLGNLDSKFWNGQDLRLSVEDETGRELFCLQFQVTMNPNP